MPWFDCRSDEQKKIDRLQMTSQIKEVTMTPTEIIMNGVLAALFAYLKASGLSEEEAKAALMAKVAQVEALPPLPMDI